MYFENLYFMKRNCIIFLLLFTVLVAAAQDSIDENIKKGDEAMKNLDYYIALMQFGEVINSQCNTHSIDQLKKIWIAQELLQTSMGDLMKKCLNCLDTNAKSNDTISIKLLVDFYTEGIGTSKNEVMAEYWKERLTDIRNPNRVQYGQKGIDTPRGKAKMEFFAGYSANSLAPVGLTVGGVGRAVGWYLRFRTNLSFQGYTEECDDEGKIFGGLNNDRSLPERLGGKKTNMLIGTGGIIVKVDPAFFLSAGVGYCSREELYRFQSIGVVDSNPEGDFWAKRTSKSFSGVAFDLDGTFRIGKQFYGTVGVSLLNLEYVYPNAGIGLFF